MSPNLKTVQIWPNGKSVTFLPNEYGDPVRIQDGETLRELTDDEARELRIELRAEMYGERDILGCDSSLVDDLIKLSFESSSELARAFDTDEQRNIYADPSDWTLERCREYLRDYGAEEPTEGNVWKMDRDDLVEQLENAGIECRDDENTETLREAVIANIDDETLDGLADWREYCRTEAQEHPAEPYEWWRVSSWLCDQLHAIGEVTIDNGYGHWWGRTCSGQAWIMDGTLQTVAASFEKDGR